MQRNYIFLQGDGSFPHKYSDTLFCKACFSDIQLPLHFILFSPRHFDAGAVGEDDELVAVADPDDVVEIDQMRFVGPDEAEFGQHILEMFQRFAGNERPFVDQMNDRIVSVCFQAKDFVHHKEENTFARRHCQAEVLDVPLVDVGCEILEK